MQAYQSHKIVHAAKILAITKTNDGAHISLDMPGGEVTSLDTRAVFRIAGAAEEAGHRVVGGYLVCYDKGTDKEYWSWSPPEQFEAGYTIAQPSSGKSDIKGYRQLSPYEINMINTVKDMGAQLGQLVESMRAAEEFDQRWVSEGATDLQKGLMSLTRAIAQPTFF